jgi:hypothetical protein
MFKKMENVVGSFNEIIEENVYACTMKRIQKGMRRSVYLQKKLDELNIILMERRCENSYKKFIK